MSKLPMQARLWALRHSKAAWRRNIERAAQREKERDYPYFIVTEGGFVFGPYGASWDTDKLLMEWRLMLHRSIEQPPLLGLPLWIPPA